MAKAGESNSEKLSALIATIEIEAYAPGHADARKELLDFLHAGGARTGGARGPRGGRARTATTSVRRADGDRPAAPLGSVRPFVERALREHPGATATEIPGHAASDIERQVKLSSIRVALRNGGMRGRYVSYEGRWSLSVLEASPSGPKEAASSEPPPGSAAYEEEAPEPVSAEADATAATAAGEEKGGRTHGLNL